MTTGLTLSLCSSAALAQELQSQGKAVAAFNEVCVKGYPDSGRIPERARQNGFQHVEDQKWVSKDGKAILVYIPEGETKVTLKINAADLVKSTGWSFITLGFSARKPEGACYMIYNTDPKGMARHFSKFGEPTAKAKVRANGARVSMNMPHSGLRTTIASQPTKLQGKPTMTLLSIKQR